MVQNNRTKQSFMQWFVATAMSNIKHWSFNTTVNIKHVGSFGSTSSSNILMGGSPITINYVKFMGVSQKKLIRMKLGVSLKIF